MDLIKRKLGAQSGTAVLEMALVLPILLVLLFSMVILGIAINSKIAVSVAARESARYYAVHYSSPTVDTETRNIAEQRLKDAVTANSTEFTQSFNKNTDVVITISADGNYVTVTVTYHQNSFIPNLLKLIGGNSWGTRFDLRSAATFRIER